MEKPYELLARFRPDGTIGGIHCRTIVTINGKDYENDPVPLSSATDPAFTQFTEVFASKAVEEKLLADAALDSANQVVADLEAELKRKCTNILNLQDQLEISKKEADVLRASIQAMHAESEEFRTSMMKSLLELREELKVAQARDAAARAATVDEPIDVKFEVER